MTDTININEHVTIDEQIEILKRARDLIWEPESWTTGDWKCPIFERNADGTIVTDANGAGIPVKNENGSVCQQYCAEGAVNQATYDVLGKERALQLGAVRFDQEKGELVFAGNEEELGYDPTKLLGLDYMAEEEGYESLMSMNDSEVDDYDGDESIEVHHKKIHQGIIGILSEKMAELRVRKERSA